MYYQCTLKVLHLILLTFVRQSRKINIYVYYFATSNDNSLQKCLSEFLRKAKSVSSLDLRMYINMFMQLSGSEEENKRFDGKIKDEKVCHVSCVLDMVSNDEDACFVFDLTL